MNGRSLGQKSSRFGGGLLSFVFETHNVAISSVLLLLKLYGTTVCNSRGVLHDGIRGLRGDAAVVVVVPAHPDVALVTPGHAPAVLHDVIVLQKKVVGMYVNPSRRSFIQIHHSVLCSVSDGEDSVVEVRLRAHGLLEDALLVEAERLVRGVDSHGDRTDSRHGLRQSLLIPVKVEC